MKQIEMFGEAKWIEANGKDVGSSILIRRTFEAREGERAKITLIGLGTFVLYVNGKRVSEEYFMPLNSEYDNAGVPEGEVLNYRVYAVEYDLTPYLQTGKNALSVLLGFGWYTGTHLWGEVYKVHGEKKLIYKLDFTDGQSVRSLYSDGEESWRNAFVVGGNLHTGETHDYTLWEDRFLLPDSFESGWEKVKITNNVESEYLFTDCPADTLQQQIQPVLIYECEEYALYDVGRNISGYPVLCAAENCEEKIEVFFSEQLSEDGKDLRADRMHGQKMCYKACAEQELYPRFTWFAFRYFRVHGKATCKQVDVIFSNVKVTSRFETDNETLNWIYQTFVHTQQNNMHRGIPSDCPHIERLGYTGDGQLICRSALHVFDGQKFYKKWIGDISDCQDRKTGHVQYTAPYIPAGGGPGGWGSAIVSVPYEFWKYYGDASVIEELYPQMLRYLDFMEAHSESGLVTSELPDRWCLGDWCTPPDNSTLPAPFVNTYFYIKAAQRTAEIARVLGKTEDLPDLEARIEKCKRAINTFYYNDGRDQTYVGNVQGASAFALDLGLGTQLTKEKLISRYEREAYYDTGIFGTEVVTRMLFTLGRADVAVRLLTQDTPHGFGRWKKEGATTFPEYWGWKRSDDHPMFGSVVASMFEYLAGIRQTADSVGYERVLIAPMLVEGINRLSGEIATPKGKIEVAYVKENGKCRYTVRVPAGVAATVRAEGGEEFLLTDGACTFTV